MIIDRIQRIFSTNRFSSLLLEVFAIFLGISASFAVEEWRQERHDRENLERYLHAIYFDALREEALARRFVYRGNQAVVAIHTLLNEDTARLTDAELLILMNRVFRTWALPRGDSSYRALLESGISIPFDHTMQVLNSSYERNSIARNQLDAQTADHNQVVNQLRSRYGTASNPEASVRNEDYSVRAGNRFDQPAYQGIRKLFFVDGQFVPQVESVKRAREALLLPEMRQTLNAEYESVMLAIDTAISLTGSAFGVRQAIRERLPELRIQINSLALVGDATPTQWSEFKGLPLEREHEDSDWWSADIELSDGSIELIADENWGTSWGAPISWNHVDPLIDDRNFQGDPGEVFPRGVAEFDGLNIPIRAGRYEVRFNSHSFEYSFTRLDE